MDPVDFREKWTEFSTEREALVKRRDEIELELHEIRGKLKHLDKVLENLLPLSDLTNFAAIEISNLGITDAIRRILQTNKGKKFGAGEIREELQGWRYDLSGLTAPMASIYKILSRLAEKPEEVTREKDGLRVYYTWVGDDEIPF
jgi:hypothetical protein